jgi:subtilase family serine protease
LESANNQHRCWNSSANPIIIQPGDTATMVFHITMASAGAFSDCAVVDPNNVIAESDETNNTACFSTKIIP